MIKKLCISFVLSIGFVFFAKGAESGRFILNGSVFIADEFINDLLLVKPEADLTLSDLTTLFLWFKSGYKNDDFVTTYQYLIKYAELFLIRSNFAEIALFERDFSLGYIQWYSYLRNAIKLFSNEIAILKRSQSMISCR